MDFRGGSCEFATALRRREVELQSRHVDSRETHPWRSLDQLPAASNWLPLVRRRERQPLVALTDPLSPFRSVWTSTRQGTVRRICPCTTNTLPFHCKIINFVEESRVSFLFFLKVCHWFLRHFEVLEIWITRGVIYLIRLHYESTPNRDYSSLELWIFLRPLTWRHTN